MNAAATRGRAELTLSEASRGRPPALPEPGASGGGWGSPLKQRFQIPVLAEK